jgi:hypothetical protein
MGITREIVEAVHGRLAGLLPGLRVEFFPERPAEYRLNHSVGALLVSHLGGKFEEPDDIGFVVQARTVKLSVTVVLKQLNGRDGALDVLDLVRAALVGFKPPHCRRKLYALDEKFLGEEAGIWQYALDFATEAVQVEDADIGTEPLLTQVTYEETQ